MGGMFGRDKDLNWKKFKDLKFFAAMGSAGGGKNEVDSRFLSKFAAFNVIFPDDDTLKHIYNSILKGHLDIFNKELIPICDLLIEITLKIFKVSMIPESNRLSLLTFFVQVVSRVHIHML